MKKLFLILLFSMFFISFSSAFNWTDGSLISYYKLDNTTGTVYDMTGTNDGVNNGATRGITGKINTAFNFEESENDYVNLSHDSSLNPNNITISTWVKVESHSGEDFIVGKWSPNSYGLALNATNNVFQGVFVTGAGENRAYGNTTFNLNEWYHVVTTWNSVDGGKLYQNGVLIGEVNDNLGTLQTSSADTIIGALMTGPLLEFDGIIDEVGLWSKSLNSTEISELYNSGDGLPYGSLVVLNSPSNGSFSSNNSVTFNFSAYSDGSNSLVNGSLYFSKNGGAWQINETKSLSGYLDTDTFSKTFSSGDSIEWNVYVCYSDDSCLYATDNFTLTIDSTDPSISISSPSSLENYGRTNGNLTLNFTVTDTNLDTCWYDYNNTNTTISCSSGVLSSNSFSITPQQNLTVYANDSAGNLGSEQIIWDYKVFENSRTHNTTSYETSYESYQINLTANSSLTAVNLNYNGTLYSMTNQGSGIWSYSRDLPSSVIGNDSISFRFTYFGDTINSDYTTYQNVSYIYFTLCNTTYSTNFLNLIFKDEGNSSLIQASIPTSTFTYYLGSGTQTKSYQYINNTIDYNFSFCASPVDKTIHVIPYTQYKQGSVYPQRIWNPSAQSYTNSSTNQSLYLLSSADGIYVTFQVINTADQLISGVDVTATREISGSDVEVASGTTSAAGSVTFWLNPDFTHTFVFSKTGYTTYTYDDAPTQTSYTITLGQAQSTINSTIRGIKYSILPTNSYLENGTAYNFGFNLTSSYWDVSEYGYNLRLANGTIIATNSTGTEGTNLISNYNVNNQTIIYMDYYWVIDGNYTNATTYWIIQNTEYEGYSIKTFFTDLSSFLNSGLFGLDNFGRNLIVFIILFVSVGIVSYKYGIVSPLGVMTLMFSIVFFFDVVIGLIPSIRGIDNLPTFVVGIMLALTILNEVRLR